MRDDTLRGWVCAGGRRGDEASGIAGSCRMTDRAGAHEGKERMRISVHDGARDSLDGTTDTCVRLPYPLLAQMTLTPLLSLRTEGVHSDRNSPI